MSPLLKTDSPLYRKRLVRELNRLSGLGFYAPNANGHNVRSHSARIKGGVIQCYCFACEHWFTPVRERFFDSYGAEIVASTCVKDFGH